MDDFPLEDGKILRLKHSLFDRDALVLSHTSHRIELRSDATPRKVILEVPDAMKYLGIWHAPKKEAPYVCLDDNRGVSGRTGREVPRYGDAAVFPDANAPSAESGNGTPQR